MHLFCVKDISRTTLPRNLKFCTVTSKTSCIVGKKIKAMGPGPLELFPFVVLAIKLCIFLNIFYTRFQILIKFILPMHLYALHM